LHKQKDISTPTENFAYSKNGTSL